MMTKEILNFLEKNKNENNVKGMERFGINSTNTYGISMPKLRELANKYRKNHSLALELWDTGIHEAKILAALIDDPLLVDEDQMEKWVLGIDSWDVCDQLIMNLFDKTQLAYQKAFEWAEREEEFVKRAGFVMMASLALHDKKAENAKMEQFYPAIIKHSMDERNFVKKAVNWALRQIGKRNKELYFSAIEISNRILDINYDSRSARWIAKDALREFENEKLRKRLGI
jgi:3-methyladenine DNA glycosylase AlkD